MTSKKIIVLGLLAAGTLAACTEHAYMREEVADRLAHPVWMVEREIPAGQFSLMAYERMHERHEPATIYIEGDGELTGDFRMDSKNPTPRNPVALHIATRDLAENVVYLARPCQYSGVEGCDTAYWGNKRLSQEVIDSYQAALDEIKKRYDIEGFNLVGFDGGGGIAAILAAKRTDVLSLRTVAGNLDTAVYAQTHGIPPLDGSLNPVDFAGQLVSVPQCHYVGGQDTVIPPAILQSYLQALGPSNCVQYKFVQEAEHQKGWVDKWPEFLEQSCACQGPVEPVAYTPPVEDFAPIAPEVPEKP